MKRITRLLCLLFVFVIAFSTTAFAAEYQDQRASSYFAITSANIKKTSTGLEILFDVTGVDIMDQIGAKTIVLQRSLDGVSWTSVKTYSKDTYPQMIEKDAAFHNCSLTYTAAKGYYYKACVTFYAKKGTGTGELVQCTSKLKL